MDKSIDVVLSSSYIRAIDTVKDFTDRNGLVVESIHDFRERKLDGECLDDYVSFSKRQWSDFTYRLSDGETLVEVWERNVAELVSAINQYKDKIL
ncbi:MAG: histidine phosphatase family protein [Lachnospirales bacterium]